MHTDLLAFVVALLGIAVLLGLRDTPCHDAACATFHQRHLADEAKQRQDKFERDAHRFHSRDWPQKNCSYCTGGGWQS